MLSTRLDGKVALVTGGSKGIGKGIAQAFIDQGARVMIVARKPDALEATAKELGNGTEWLAANVGDETQAEMAIDATLERLGALDILVNNAGANPYAGVTIDADLPRWDKTFQINVRAPFAWTQLAWRKYLREHGGSVINVASVGGFRTSAALGVYSVSKAAVIQLTKQLAAELGPQVRVNCIAPALVRTDFARVLWDAGRGDKVAQAYPLKRLGEIEDCGAAAVFLATDASRWITGHTIVLDGGQLVATNELPLSE